MCTIEVSSEQSTRPINVPYSACTSCKVRPHSPITCLASSLGIRQLLASIPQHTNKVPPHVGRLAWFPPRQAIHDSIAARGWSIAHMGRTAHIFFRLLFWISVFLDGRGRFLRWRTATLGRWRSSTARCSNLFLHRLECYFFSQL